MRTSEQIRAQLEEFRGLLPPAGTRPTTGDFAMRLQMEAWHSHQEELEREMKQAEQAEANQKRVDVEGPNIFKTGSSGQNVLSRNVFIEGNIKFINELTIDGRVEGEIFSDGVLTVGVNGDVQGEIRTKSAIVFGKVTGNMIVSERCELKATAQVVGDLKAGRLVMEEGATFVGTSEVWTNKGPLPSATPLDAGVKTPAKEDVSSKLEAALAEA